jgi:GntR family transcriptional regulator
MPIDSDSPVPIFRQICDEIRQLIAAGVYRPGELLPSIRAQASRLKVNPNTVARAYEHLERESLVESQRGIGLAVAAGADETARNRSREAVYEAFRRAIQDGRSARVSGDTLQKLFRQALAEGDGEPGHSDETAALNQTGESP